MKKVKILLICLFSYISVFSAPFHLPLEMSAYFEEFEAELKLPPPVSPIEMTVEQYIQMYKVMAITEMQRSGIPASITLAQGILESRYGNSYLATEGNNHFGIKCHVGWQGERVYADDDAPNECFRKYKNAEESFLDHSDFLSNKSRYAFLFDLDMRDYKGWAHGLKKAGYATNPKYAELLISLVERHELYQYDNVGGNQTVVTAPDNGMDGGHTNINVPGRVGGNQTVVTVPGKQISPPELFYYNRIRTLMFDYDVTPQHVAQIYPKVSLKRLLKYNDLKSIGKLIPANKKVFLQPKRCKAPVRHKEHQVLRGQTMYDISQLYGVKLKRLYKRNRMKLGTEPAIGEIIKLRRKRKYSPQLRTTQVGNNFPTKKPNNIRKGTLKPSKNDNTFQPQPKPKPIIQPSPTTPAPPATGHEGLPNSFTYTVQVGDTLYALAQRFNTSVPEIKAINNLVEDVLSVGMVLRIPRGK